MRIKLTLVLRFATEYELSNQFNNLDIPEKDDIELLCIGYGQEQEFEKASQHYSSNFNNIRFEYVEGDYAFARTRAANLAYGEFVLFPSIRYTYNIEDVLKSIDESRSKHAESIILKSNNRARIEGWKKNRAPLFIDIDSVTKNYFQAFGCIFYYSVLSKALLERINKHVYSDTCRDDAYIFAIACNSYSTMIIGNGINPVEKSITDDKSHTFKAKYGTNSLPDSINLILEFRSMIKEKSNANLVDSYMRLYASRIRTYLIQNLDYKYRKPVLDIISNDERTVDFFINDQPPAWKKNHRRNYVFSRSALEMFFELKKMKDCNHIKPKEIVQSKTINPKVSIIVPAYNSSEYVDKALHSALNQTYENFEIICIDDGSTDNTLDILVNIAKSDERISVYTQLNMGLSVTRNNGIELSKGEFVYFLDSDDLIDTDLLETCMQQIEKNELDMVLFDAITFYESETTNEVHSDFNNYYERHFEYNEVLNGTELMLRMYENGEYRSSPCLYIAKKSIITDNKLSFIPGILHEDNAFTYELLNCAMRASHINKGLYLRRIHTDSIMTAKKTFKNAYGYFVCSYKLLSRDYVVNPEYADMANYLASNLSYSMLRKSIQDLLDAEEGQDGAAYALSTSNLKLLSMFVLEIVRTTRRLDRRNTELAALQKKLSIAQDRLNRSISQISSHKTKKPKFNITRIVSFFRPSH